MQRLPPSGGRGKLLNHQQELAIVDMVVANNAIKLHEIQSRILEDQEIFHNINSISLATITRVLSKHRVRMKQLYTVPFERNSERVKVLRQQYVQQYVNVQFYKLCTFQVGNLLSNRLQYCMVYSTIMA